MARICLVAESKAQLHIKALAENLFTSALFKKSRDYARVKCDRWYILTGAYGLVEPSRLLEPYKNLFDSLAADDKFRWAQRVLDTITRQRITAYDRLIILAGPSYREYLMPVFQARRFVVETPLQGLDAVGQLAWLDEAVRS